MGKKMSEIETFERFANLERRNFTNYSLSGYDLTGASLRHTVLRDADLSHTTLKIADLSYADLRMANLRGADLSGANLTSADLRGADLRGTKLKDVNFVNTKQELTKLGFLHKFHNSLPSFESLFLYSLFPGIIILLFIANLFYSIGYDKGIVVNKCKITKTYNVESK